MKVCLAESMQAFGVVGCLPPAPVALPVIEGAFKERRASREGVPFEALSIKKRDRYASLLMAVLGGLKSGPVTPAQALRASGAKVKNVHQMLRVAVEKGYAKRVVRDEQCGKPLHANVVCLYGLTALGRKALGDAGLKNEV